jgi:hypothetical protein
MPPTFYSASVSKLLLCLSEAKTLALDVTATSLCEFVSGTSNSAGVRQKGGGGY